MTPLLLDSIAVYRLTRLVTADTITQPLRERVIAQAYGKANGVTFDSRQNEDGYWDEAVAADRAEGRPVPKLADLVTCRYCSGLWLALFAVAARRLAPRLWDPLARALAFSAAAALLAGLEE